MNFPIDHNLGGHAEILLGNIASQGWLNLLPIRVVTFKQMNLSIELCGDLRAANQIILLTANRSMKSIYLFWACSNPGPVLNCLFKSFSIFPKNIDG